MLAPISHPRRDGYSSFRKLKQYITTERDPDTGKEKYRGDYLLSSNLLSLDTAHLEMAGVAAQNARVKDPIYHFQITWQEGEQPTREQWEKAVHRSVAALGFTEHQFIAAAHDNTKHFHVHVMINRVHPEQYNAHSPRQDMPALDKTMRELEHEDDWRESKGFYRWDDATSQAVRNTAEEMRAIREERRDAPRGTAAKIEHYNDVESFQSYARSVAAKPLKQLLQHASCTWQEVHTLLASKGLRLERGEKGGFTVCSSAQNIRVKASDVFRDTFAGKANRERLSTGLGEWQEPQTTDVQPNQVYDAPAKQAKATVRDPERREEQKKARLESRQSLRSDFRLYRTEKREEQKAYTAAVRQQRVMLLASLKEKKRAIRQRNTAWTDKRAAISLATAETVVAQRLLAVRAKRERAERGPLTYQMWVTAQAQKGDKRAIAQLRGWRYQDQRNMRALENELRIGNATHLNVTGVDASDVASWERLTNDDLKEIVHAEHITNSMRSMRMTVNRQTGDVAYLLQGKAVLVDRGKAITVTSKDETAAVLALEMAVRKYGFRIAAQGSEQWRQEMARVAARHGIYVEFADPAMQRVMNTEKAKRAFDSQQMGWAQVSGGLGAMTAEQREVATVAYKQWIKSNPRAAQVADLNHYVALCQGPQATALRSQANRWMQMRDSIIASRATINFRNDDAAKDFLSALYGRSAAQVYQARIAAAEKGGRSELNIRGVCTFEVHASPDGKREYRLRPAPGRPEARQAEELAGVLQQSAAEANKRSLSPAIRFDSQSRRPRGGRGR